MMEAGLMFEGFLKGIVPTMNCEELAVTSAAALEVGVVLVLVASVQFHWLHYGNTTLMIPALGLGGAFCTK